jgi:hypothetical protein
MKFEAYWERLLQLELPGRLHQGPRCSWHTREQEQANDFLSLGFRPRAFRNSVLSTIRLLQHSYIDLVGSWRSWPSTAKIEWRINGDRRLKYGEREPMAKNRGKGVQENPNHQTRRWVQALKYPACRYTTLTRRGDRHPHINSHVALAGRRRLPLSPAQT